jgi:hypothetical protein
MQSFVLYTLSVDVLWQMVSSQWARHHSKHILWLPALPT